MITQDKIYSFLKELGFDVPVGIFGYIAAIQFHWIQEAQHIFTALLTALVCCAGVHYLKKLLVLIDKGVKSLLKKLWKSE